MKQQITNLILEMIGSDTVIKVSENMETYQGYNKALQYMREKAPDIAERICDEINNPVEYNTAQKYVLKTAIENLGEIDDEQYWDLGIEDNTTPLSDNHKEV